MVHHPVLEYVTGSTRNFLISQEQFIALAKFNNKPQLLHRLNNGKCMLLIVDQLPFPAGSDKGKIKIPQVVENSSSA